MGELAGVLTQEGEDLALAAGEGHGLPVSGLFSHCMLV
jgi:hypothetical protein